MMPKFNQFAEVLLCAILCAITRSAHAERIQVGLSFGAFYPSDSLIQDRFGKQIISFGFSPMSLRKPNASYLEPNVNVISAQKGSEDLLVIPATLRFVKTFGDPQGRTVPYFAVGAGGYYSYYDIYSPTASARYTDTHWGSTANAELGMILDQTTSLVVRYNWFSKAQGLRFDGLSLGISIRVGGI